MIPENTDQDRADEHRTRSLKYARWVGYAMGLLLLVSGTGYIITGSTTFNSFKGIYFLIYATVLLFPYPRLKERSWKFCFGLLTAASVLFVFVMIASVMFAYMAAAERGERLGVPGFEGMLIFGALLQVPAVFFQRRPDLLS